MGLSGSFLISRAVQVVAELGVADLVTGKARTLDELAEATRTRPDALGRLLRPLVGCGLFTCDADGAYASTALSRLLESGHEDSLRPWFQLGYRLTYRMLDDPISTLRTGTPSFQQRFGASFFEHLARHPDDLAVFNAAMACLTRRTARAVADAYDFGTVGRIGDIGGGLGTLLAEICARNPHVGGFVLDQSHQVEAARAALDARGLRDRCTASAGDFFTAVPPADMYLLSWILHDWDDDEALRILHNCRRANGDPSARLLIVEAVLPEQPGLDAATVLDLVMLFGLGGRERTASQYAALLAKSGYRHTRTIEIGVAGMAVIEARPDN
ncbi:methyltransferase [Streptomyces sp. NPDC002088]|uniref:methyltransferase n=1 Tax=Streptomyces sp. NPDC002088 TaxID=3154665 RepID=UPI00331CA27A